MLYFSRQIRSVIVWFAMMPAALLAGMQLPECECATGEHRFFCTRMFEPTLPATSAVQSGTKLSCCAKQSSNQPKAAACCTAKSEAGGKCLVSNTSSEPCSQCKAIPSSPTNILERVSVPAADWITWLPLGYSADQESLIALQGNERLLPASDRLPMTDRVIVLCCLLN